MLKVMGSQWLPVKSFEDYYEVSSEGFVKRVKKSQGTSADVLKQQYVSEILRGVKRCRV